MPINKNLPYEAIAKRIRALRESKGETQDTLAKLLDISRPTWINYESGKQQIGIGDLYVLSEYFEVEIADFLPTTKEMMYQSNPDNLLENDSRIGAGPKETLKDFIEKLRKG